MKLKKYQHIIPTVSLVKRASVATSPTTIPPKEQHEVVKFILKYANIVWAYLKTLPSKWVSVIQCFFAYKFVIIIAFFICFYQHHFTFVMFSLALE